jgi:molybdate transport system substrate-binding protein
MKSLHRLGRAIAILSVVTITSFATHTRLALAAAEGEPLVVSAAASTKDVVEALGQAFKTASGVDVKVNPGPSNALASQILAGAPVDLFLSANQQWADEVKKGGLATESVRLLTSKLVIVVPKNNPGDVHEPKDLLSPKVKKLALADEKVPAGIYGGQALKKLDLLRPLTDQGKIVRGQDVRNTLSFVERGEAEAGIVYSTDIRAASGAVAAYEFDPSLHDEIVYVLVLLNHGQSNPAAVKLYAFLQSAGADETYKSFGFTRLH